MNYIKRAVWAAVVMLASPPLSAQAQAPILNGVTNFFNFGSGSDEGVIPGGQLAVDAAGTMYGMTYCGGPTNCGEIYKIDQAGNEAVLYNFTGGADGAGPIAGLTLGPDGNLYGATFYGDTAPDFIVNTASVFKVTPTGALMPICEFPDAAGAVPNSEVILDADGNIYGTTSFLDSMGVALNSGGEIFKITPAGAYTVLYTSPTFNFQGRLLLDNNGNLYGTTLDGGANKIGSVFELSPAGSMTTVYSFDGGEDGAYPAAGLTFGSDGNLYGMTTLDGESNGGTVFKVTPSGNLTTLYSFDSDGNPKNYYGDPDFSMIEGSDGNLYGVTFAEGINDWGTIFQLTPSGQFTTLYRRGSIYNPSFTTIGGDPNGSPVEGPNGALYSTTASGGSGENGWGTLIKIKVPSLTATAVSRFDFNRDHHADLLWYNTASGAVSRWLMNDQSILNYGPAFAQIDPSTGWQPVAAPGTTTDGYPDLLWWNSQTGDLSVWTLQDQTVTSYGAAFNQIKNTNWMPVAVADNAPLTGNWTMVLQNKADGDISRWMVSGQTVTSAGPTIASLGPNSPWQVVGAPDLDGDGKSDLLFWNSQTGEVSYWSCDLANSKVLAYHGDIAVLADTSWHLVGSEDTNGDGYPDLVWWNVRTGEASRWLMGAGASGGGPTVTGYGADTTQVQDTTWQPTALR